MYDKTRTCCFTGHRTIPANETELVVKNLHSTVERLVHMGYRQFISGGAIGFDLVAASMIAVLKEQGCPLMLSFVLPCRDHDLYWNARHRARFQELQVHADSVSVLQGAYTDGCMLRRNQYMVDHSSACVAYLRRSASGTGQTVRYANQQGVEIFAI